MIHLSRLEKQCMGLRSDGLTVQTIEERLHLEKGEFQRIMSHIATRIKTASDSIHLIKIMNSRKKPRVIDYGNLTYKGKPLTQEDIWTIMCKYHAKHPEDKAFGKLIIVGQKILESQA